MKVLVTGAAGRIGRAVCRQLAQDHRVTGTDRVPSATTDVLADLQVPGAWRGLLEGMDAVVHCAALHAPHVGQVDDALFDAVNVQATEALARACLDAGVPRLVFTSTTALYGSASTPAGHAAWVTEDTVPQPRTVYHHSKLRAEQALLALTRQSPGLTVTVLRMSRCFPEPAPQMALYRLHRGVDARDVAAAHGRALTVPADRAYRCFVISGATPFEAGDALALAQDAPAVIHHRAPALARAFEQRGWPLPARIDRVYCARRAMQALGWQPLHGFDAVLQQWDQRAPEVLAP